MSSLKKRPIPPLTDKKAQEYIKLINKATENFVGNFDELEATPTVLHRKSVTKPSQEHRCCDCVTSKISST